MSLTEPSLSPKTLAGILDALERKGPLSRRELAALASVSPSTVSRAAEYLTGVGVLTPSSPQTEQRTAPTLAPAAVLPVLTLRRGQGSVHALNARLELLGTSVTELNPDGNREECLRLLCRRAMTLLSGCAKASALPVAAPVLLVERDESAQGRWRETVTDTMGVAPLAMIREDTAIAYGLPREALPENAASLLYLRTGEMNSAYLLARSDTGDWVKSPPKQTLGEALTRYLRREDGAAEAQRRGVLRFIRDLSGFTRPDLLLLEDPRGLFRKENPWREALPEGVELIHRKSPPTGLSLPITGAAEYARRLLWEKMAGLSV